MRLNPKKESLEKRNTYFIMVLPLTKLLLLTLPKTMGLLCLQCLITSVLYESTQRVDCFRNTKKIIMMVIEVMIMWNQS